MRAVMGLLSKRIPLVWPLGVFPVAAMASVVLFACNQDSAASNAGRDTHMGTVRAAAPPPTESVAPVSPAVPAPTVAPAPPAVGSASAPMPAVPAKKEKP